MRSRIRSYSVSCLFFPAGIFFTIIIIFSAVSCKTTENRDQELYVNEKFALDKTVSENTAVKDSGVKDLSESEFPGVYKLTGDPICSISLVIKKDSDGYSYSFSGGITSSGKIGMEKKEDAIYIYFNGTRCGGNKEPAAGIYSNKTILIQKSGNTMSRNSCFSDCDSKNLRFVKN